MPRRVPGIYYVERDWEAFMAPVATSNPETTITTTSSNGTIVANYDGDLSITSNGYTIPLHSRNYISDYITYDYSNVTIPTYDTYSPTYEFTYNPKSGLQLNFDELYEYGIKPPKRCIRI